MIEQTHDRVGGAVCGTSGHSPCAGDRTQRIRLVARVPQIPQHHLHRIPGCDGCGDDGAERADAFDRRRQAPVGVLAEDRGWFVFAQEEVSHRRHRALWGAARRCEPAQCAAQVAEIGGVGLAEWAHEQGAGVLLVRGAENGFDHVEQRADHRVLCGRDFRARIDDGDADGIALALEQLGAVANGAENDCHPVPRHLVHVVHAQQVVRDDGRFLGRGALGAEGHRRHLVRVGRHAGLGDDPAPSCGARETLGEDARRTGCGRAAVHLGELDFPGVLLGELLGELVTRPTEPEDRLVPAVCGDDRSARAGDRGDELASHGVDELAIVYHDEVDGIGAGE